MDNLNKHDYLFQSALLIDDSHSDLILNKSILLNHHFTANVFTADSALAGLELLKKLAGTGQRIPEIIFLDIQMPGMNGFDFLKEFEKLPSSIRHFTSIVMLTASTDIIDYYRAIKNPYVLNYLKKPLNLVELRSLAA